jgi:hypothetical protein
VYVLQNTTKPKKKIGRPFEENPKDHPVTIRLTADEYSRLREYAEMHSMTLTQVMMEGINLVYSK